MSGQSRGSDKKKLERTAQKLAGAWHAQKKGGSISWMLASYYHRAICSYLRTKAGVSGLRMAQAEGYLREFLALEKHCDTARLPEILKNFLRTGVWIDENPKHTLTHKLFSLYPVILHAIARQGIRDFKDAQPKANFQRMLMQKEFPFQRLLEGSLGMVWSVWYVPQAIQTSLSLLLALNPKDEYPEARAIRRHFIIHLGGTNTGKTYAGFQRLIHAETGVYLAPLRLLALEAQETLLDAGIECGLTTGEEEDYRDYDTHIAATAEKLNLKRFYDVAVIDECQMIADSQRGYAWTRAILGVQAPEIHLCAAPEAKDILLRLIESCGDSYEIEIHKRQTPLVCMSHPVDMEHVQPGDALITFSKVEVLSVAEDLRQEGKEPAIIYGALPYATRRKQMEGFLEGRMKYIVATDAIGMGLNLPIRRILFMATEKFDGVERRELKPEEIRQIAGRAGRFGMYDTGYVGATENIGVIRAGLCAFVPPISYAVVGFSDMVLKADFDLLEVLGEWSKMSPPEPYRKLDISRYLSVISKMREQGFAFSKEQELRAANIPFDETDDSLWQVFFDFLRAFQEGEPIEQPEFPDNGERTLPELEAYYRKLDLYFSFSKAFECPVDQERLSDSRERTANEINEILLYRLRNNIRFCKRCGKALPPHHRGSLCDSCFQREKSSSNRPFWASRNRQ